MEDAGPGFEEKLLDRPAVQEESEEGQGYVQGSVDKVFETENK